MKTDSINLSAPQGFDALRARGLRYLFCDCAGNYWASSVKPIHLNSSMWAVPVNSVLIENCPFSLAAEDAPFDLASEYIWKPADYFTQSSRKDG